MRLLDFDLAEHFFENDIQGGSRMANFGRFNIYDETNASAVDTNASVWQLFFVCIAGSSDLLWEPKPDCLPR